MSQHLELFSVEFEEPEAIEPKKLLVFGRRVYLNDKILGRCTSCGSHVLERHGHCIECLNSKVCNCEHCRQIASIHASIQNDLYWADRDLGEKYEETLRSQGLPFPWIQFRIQKYLRENERYKEVLREDIRKYRTMPTAEKVLIGRNWKTEDGCQLSFKEVVIEHVDSYQGMVEIEAECQRVAEQMTRLSLYDCITPEDYEQYLSQGEAF
jgi:hypothetical protein